MHAAISLGALGLGFGLEVVIHLSDDGLQVALEEAITEGDEQQSEAGQGQQPADVALGGEDGDGEDDVAGGHDDEAGADDGFIVLGAIGNDAAHEAKHIDAAIEDGVDDGTGLVAQSEFGAEEEHQHGIHDVIPEAFAHVGEGGRDESLGMVFEHKNQFFSR